MAVALGLPVLQRPCLDLEIPSPVQVPPHAQDLSFLAAAVVLLAIYESNISISGQLSPGVRHCALYSPPCAYFPAPILQTHRVGRQGSWPGAFTGRDALVLKSPAKAKAALPPAQGQSQESPES